MILPTIYILLFIFSCYSPNQNLLAISYHLNLGYRFIRLLACDNSTYQLLVQHRDSIIFYLQYYILLIFSNILIYFLLYYFFIYSFNFQSSTYSFIQFLLISIALLAIASIFISSRISILIYRLTLKSISIQLELHLVQVWASSKPVGTEPLRFQVQILEIRTNPDPVQAVTNISRQAVGTCNIKNFQWFSEFNFSYLRPISRAYEIYL